MMVRLLAAFAAILLGANTPAAGVPVGEDAYAKHVKPLLHEKCSACHGALKQKADLRTDAIQFLRAGNDNGTLIVPGKAAESRLMHAVEGTHDLEKMPKDGAPLTAAEVKLLREWIDRGAAGPPSEPVPPGPRDHWAFRKPVRPDVQAAKNANWVRNPIDALVAAEHERLGLSPMPEASRRVLLRRVYFDLIGLPPTPKELAEFLADNSPHAYEKVVDRLLADERHGQRWGRHWLDVWRYSDWAGYKEEIRESKRGIWRWRDWAVEAVHADKPYDRMVREMLAADELCPDDPGAQRATGYLARSWYKFNKHVWMDNTVEHAGKAFLGLTFNCAKCHDHKYDPISQEEYFAFRACFEPLDIRMDPVPGGADPEKDGRPQAYDKDAAAQTLLLKRGDEKMPDKERGTIAPAIPAVFGAMAKIEQVELPAVAFYPGLSAEVRADVLRAEKASLDAALAAAEKATTSDAKADAIKLASAKVTAARLELAAVEAQLAADALKYKLPDAKRILAGDAPSTDVDDAARAANTAERAAAVASAEAALLEAEQVSAAADAAVKPGDAKTRAAADAAKKKIEPLRKALDAAKANAAKPPSTDYKPLSPVYPATSTGRRLALANWIASRDNPLTARVAVNHMWMRHVGEPLVPTVFDFGLNGRPPANPKLLDWLACELMEHGWSLRHVHRLIVTSATYRQASGPADDAGRAVYFANLRIDPDNRLNWRANVRRLEAEAVRDAVLVVGGTLDPSMGGPELGQDEWQTTNRRSLYYRNAHEKQSLFAMVFDAPTPTECYRRVETITPQQALALANSPLAVTSARRAAASLSKQTGDAAEQDAAFADAAFEHCLGRPATPAEREDCVGFLSAQSSALTKAESLTPHDGADKAAVPPSKDPHQRARESLVHVLLNHNDFVTVR